MNVEKIIELLIGAKTGCLLKADYEIISGQITKALAEIEQAKCKTCKDTDSIWITKNIEGFPDEAAPCPCCSQPEPIEIQTTIDMLMDKEEQTRIGINPDDVEHKRDINQILSRILEEYILRR